MSVLLGPVSGALVAGGVSTAIASQTIRLPIHVYTGILWILNYDSGEVCVCSCADSLQCCLTNFLSTQKHRAESVLSATRSLS